MNTEDIDIGRINLEEASERGSEVQLMHPVTRAPLGIFIGVIGPDSREARTAQTETMRMAAIDPTDDEVEINRRSAGHTAKLCRSWRQGDRQELLFNGDWLPFSRENAARVMTKQRWMREQVDTFQMNRRNFPMA